MKKIKIILFTAAVLASGLAQAGDNKTEAKSETKTTAKSGTVYAWYNTLNTFPASNTVADEQTSTGCDGDISRPVCERGYLPAQLNNPNDPAQGVKEDQLDSPSEIIRQHVD